jgi:hypothetical protein
MLVGEEKTRKEEIMSKVTNSKIKDLRTVLRTVLGSQRDDKSITGQAVLKVIQSATGQDERIELLAIALAERDSVPKQPERLPNKGIDDDTWDQLIKTHSDIVNGYMKMAFSKTNDVKGFASEILHLIDFLSEDNEKIFACAKVLFSPYVPYHELPGTPVHMTTREYKHKLASDPKRIELVEYITRLPFDERTETASMLLQVLDDTQDKGLRVAILAHAHYQIEKQVEKQVAEAITR